MKAYHADDALTAAVEKGVNYLQDHQYPNGDFCCYFAPDDHMFEWCMPDPVVFPTALIASSLLTLDRTADVAAILDKTVPYLQYQMMRGGTWNFFAKNNEKLFRLCPPDVDDTVVISHVLRSMDRRFPDNKSVLFANRNRAGLFYTWITLRLRRKMNWTHFLITLRELKYPVQSMLFWLKHDCRRRDVDAVVNANALFYFGLGDDTKPIVDHLLDVLMKGKEAEGDNWYQNPLIFYYFFARSFNRAGVEWHEAKQVVIERILGMMDASGEMGGSYLTTSLGLLALIHAGFIGSELKLAANHLLAGQATRGGWPRYIFYYSGRKKIVGWGSEEVTTGYCVEAINAYKKLVREYI